jgi:hypothetical protein
MIQCRPDEPRYIGSQDVFDLQKRVIRSILQAEQVTAAKAVFQPSTPDPVQLSTAEELKNALRRGSVERRSTMEVLRFLEQPTGRATIARLKDLRQAWADHKDDRRYVDELSAVAAEYRKSDPNEAQDSATDSRAAPTRLLRIHFDLTRVNAPPRNHLIRPGDL